MDFSQYKCPVCNEFFQNGDDIVVCPECGAPHHRECYEKENHCFFEDRHFENFSFEENSSDNAEENGGDNEGDAENATVVCPACGHENEKTSFYCNRCGFPLNFRDRQGAENSQSENAGQYQNGNQQGTPFGFGAAGYPAFDPLAGLDGDEEIADNVKVSEMAKFVGKNTQYFLIVFNRIKKFSRSKFNFAAFIFPGIYFLYRKMTGLGIALTLTLIASDVLSTYITLLPQYEQAENYFIANYPGMLSLDTQGSVTLMGSMLFIYLPVILSSVGILIRVLSGFFANRKYYKHSTKKIKEIKENYADSDISKRLESAGGVNLPLAISFGAATLIISYICTFLTFQSGITF